jgi:hypothetical protein
MHCDATLHMTKPNTFWPNVFQRSALHGIALTGKGLPVELNRHKNEPTIQKSHKQILTTEQTTFVSGPILN